MHNQWLNLMLWYDPTNPSITLCTSPIMLCPVSQQKSYLTGFCVSFVYCLLLYFSLRLYFYIAYLFLMKLWLTYIWSWFPHYNISKVCWGSKRLMRTKINFSKLLMFSVPSLQVIFWNNWQKVLGFFYMHILKYLADFWFHARISKKNCNIIKINFFFKMFHI